MSDTHTVKGLYVPPGFSTHDYYHSEETARVGCGWAKAEYGGEWEPTFVSRRVVGDAYCGQPERVVRPHWEIRRVPIAWPAPIRFLLELIGLR